MRHISMPFQCDANDQLLYHDGIGVPPPAHGHRAGILFNQLQKALVVHRDWFAEQKHSNFHGINPFQPYSQRSAMEMWIY